MGNKGFRKIDNELFKTIIQANITRSGYKILLTIIDFTIGYQKETADVSLSTFQKMTGLARSSVIDAISELEGKQAITVNRDGNSNTYKLSDIKEWTSSLHTTSEDVKKLPVDHQKATSSSSVGATKTSRVAVPATPSYKEIRNKKTFKEKGTIPGENDSFKDTEDTPKGSNSTLEDNIAALLRDKGALTMADIANLSGAYPRDVHKVIFPSPGIRNPRFKFVGRFTLGLVDSQEPANCMMCGSKATSSNPICYMPDGTEVCQGCCHIAPLHGKQRLGKQPEDPF
jgi:phage replication O-like protein O